GSFIDRHFENVGDGLVLELYFQRFAVVAVPVAGVAFHIDIRQEMHLDLDDAVALTGFAAPAFYIEGEAARLVAARAALRQFGEPVADECEGTRIGRRVGTRRAANR